MPDPFVLVEPGRLTDAAPGTRLELPDDADHHVRTVLRRSPGDALELCDGAGRTARARLTEAAAELTTEPVLHEPPATSIEVVHALPKGRKLDEVVRVLTELDVDRIVPVEAERSVVSLEGHKRAKAGDRWRAVARSAVEQARRPWLPTVEDPTTLDAVPAADPDTLLLVAHLGAATGLATAVAGGTPARVVVTIGPEGGWSDDEVATLLGRGGVGVHLGDAVLRTEHAATVAVAVVAAAAGRMGNLTT